MATMTTTLTQINDTTTLNGAVEIAAYALAGKATITVLNKASGRRFTYRITAAKVPTSKGGRKVSEKGPWFVKVRTGSEFEYMGMIGGDLKLRTTGKSRLPFSSLEFKALDYVLGKVVKGVELPAPVVVWHHNECGRCGKELTSEFRLIGYGPICCKHLDINHKELLGLDLNERLVKLRQVLHSTHQGLMGRLHIKVAPRQNPVVRDYLSAHGA